MCGTEHRSCLEKHRYNDQSQDSEAVKHESHKLESQVRFLVPQPILGDIQEPDMTNSNFRNWLRIIWLENCREHEDHNELPYTLQEYWQRYRWWLRREYRFQNKK